MKRLPVLASFVLFIALCASGAYWALQLFKPPLRPVAAPPPIAKAELNLDAAASLFGGRKTAAVAVASHYVLKGVVVARNAGESVAILATDGKPAQAVGVNAEVMRGVTVKEVHPQYVLLSEGGIVKRVQLPETTKPSLTMSGANRVPTPNALQFPGVNMNNQMPPPQGMSSGNDVPNPGFPSPGVHNPEVQMPD